MKPTPIETDHYQRLVGRKIIRIDWSKLEGEPLPVLVFDGPENADGDEPSAVVLSDPEGNGPGFLDHNL